MEDPPRFKNEEEEDQDEVVASSVKPEFLALFCVCPNQAKEDETFKSRTVNTSNSPTFPIFFIIPIQLLSVSKYEYL